MYYSIILKCYSFNLFVIFVINKPFSKKPAVTVTQPVIALGHELAFPSGLNLAFQTIEHLLTILLLEIILGIVFMFYLCASVFRGNYLPGNANFGPCSQEPAVWYVLLLHLPLRTFFTNCNTHATC